jgi:hypothetical protein
MISVTLSTVLLRLCVVAMLLFYVLAGASLALPSAPSCARCATMSKTSPVKPGASCPLSSRGHHCHGDQEHTAGKIVVCPDGCMHHESTGGEVPSPAKFLSSPRTNQFAWLPSTPVPHEAAIAPPTFVFPPPHHPPPVPLWDGFFRRVCVSI